MWQVVSASADFVPAKIALDETLFGMPLPKGIPEIIFYGWAFYEVNSSGNKEYITSQISDQPVLTAVSKEQLKNWSAKNIVAQLVWFEWNSNPPCLHKHYVKLVNQLFGN